jgi:hypothetical protein
MFVRTKKGVLCDFITCINKLCTILPKNEENIKYRKSEY